MARSKNGMGPTEGRWGGWSFYIRKGEVIGRISTNMTRKKAPTCARAEQMSKMTNLNKVWRQFGGALKGCFENKKPGATDFSGFMAANLPDARVYLPKGFNKEVICVLDNFYVSIGSLLPAIQTEESGEWVMSDIRVGNSKLDGNTAVWNWANSIVRYSDGTFQGGDELIFLRMRQQIDMNFQMPIVYPHIYRLRLDRHNYRTLSQELTLNKQLDGFQVVDGRLAARRYNGDLVAWIRLRREKDGTTHVTTQRLVGHNPLLPKYMSKEAIIEAVVSYNPRGYRKLDPQQLDYPHVSVSATSNDVNLGTVEGGGTFAPGTVVTLRAVAAPGASFVIWDDGCRDPERTFPAMSNASFKAIFVPA